jgi:filamentous hemagglutinin family protein
MRHSALPTALKSLLLALALSSPLAPALAQSITAAGDGTGTTVDYNAATQTYTINGGTQIDANLFHSFRQFGLSTVEIARFLANPDVVNILARVTGGQTSVINGLLQVSGGNNANLFILNPAGVLLGRNANLNLSGSFSVSTASGLSFGNEVFNVAGSNDFSALTGNPTGYVFLGNEGALLNEADLAVNPGQGITLAGNTVVNTGTLEAPEGTVSIVAVPEEGILRISQSGLILSLAVPTDQLNGLVESGITPLDLPGLLAGEWGGDATTVQTLPDGTVVFTASDRPINTDPGTVTSTGIVDVSGVEGGQVVFVGEDIALPEGLIDISGAIGGELGVYARDELSLGVTVDAAGGGHALFDPTTFTVDAAEAATIVSTLAGGNATVEASETINVDAAIDSSAQGNSNTLAFTDENSDNNLTINLNALITLGASQNLTGEGSTVNVNTTTAGIVQNGLDVVAAGGTVNLGAGTYQEGAALTINRSLTLTGAGAANTALDGNNNFHQILQVSSTVIGDININDLTVSRGWSSTAGGGIDNVWSDVSLSLTNTIVSGNTAFGAGGGIFSRGALTLVNSTVSGNTSGNDGGGIFSSRVVTLDNTTISGNTADRSGGGVSSRGVAVLNNTVVSGNTARFGGGISSIGATTLANTTISGNTASTRGGGVYISYGAATLINTTVSNNTALGRSGGGIFSNGAATLINTTVSGNTATENGGGIFGDNVVTLINTTVSGNTATENGGGIFSDSAVALSNATLAGNVADADNNGSGDGGGVFISGTRANSINNSIIANNSDSGNQVPDIGADFSTSTVTNSLIQSTTGITVGAPSNGVDGNLIGVDPLLSILTDNGGLTQTHALLPDSPAIDAGNDALSSGLTADQRGANRFNGTVDIGAFEAHYALTATAGDNQSTTVNTSFSTPLTVQLTETFANAGVAGATITFNAPATGASLDNVSQTAITNATGIASLNATANTTAGSFSVSATTPGLTGVTFNLTNNPGAATAVALATAGGDNQSTTVNTAFTDALQVSLVDAFGNNVPTSGTTVIFTAPGSGASLDTVSQTALTDTSGIASLNATANTIAGNFTVTASSTGLTDTSFNLTNNPDAANRFTVAGFATPITAGTSGTFTVTATDQFGNLATGYSGTVGFTSTDSHGAVALPSNSPLTNGVGNFNATLVTAGNQSITATDTVTGSITGSQTGITVNAAAAINLAIAGGNNQNATVNTAFSNGLQVAVTDTFGNAVSGVDVVLSAPNAGASTSLSNTILTTDTSGLATTTTTANTVAGSYQVGATATGLTGVNFDLTNTAGPATALALIGGNNQNTTVNTAFANPLQVRLVDAFGNNVSVPGTPITFTAPSSGASLDRANQTATTNASGIATTNATANTVAGDFQVGVTATGLTGINLNLSNNPGAPSALTVARGDNQSAAVNTAFADSLVVNLTDAFNNPIPNVAIAFNAPTTGASLNSTTQTATTDNNGVATVNAIANTITGNFSVQAQVGSVSANFDLENTVGSTSGAAGATLGNIGVNSLDTSALFNGHPPLESPQVLCQPIPVIDSELAEQYGVLDMPNQDDTLSSHNLRDSESVTDSPMIPRSENESTEKSQDDIELLPLCTDDLLPQI